MQIPLMIGYNEMFEDPTTFHVWGTACMNQAFNYKKKLDSKSIKSITPDYMSFNKSVLSERIGGSTGLSAMSISDMTNIPRATVIRKCKFLIDGGYLQTNNKKQYIMTGLNATRIIPHQKKIFKDKATFLRKTLNLLTIS